jgi:hypothetical protein
MTSFIDIVNRTKTIQAEMEIIRRRKYMTLADSKRVAELRAELLRISPAERFLWLGGKPAIDLFAELTNPTA